MDARRKDKIWAAAALGMVAVCCFCCKPAWSPDSDKVAFIFGVLEKGEEEGEKACQSVAIYDLTTRKTEIIARENVDEKTGAFVPMEVFWPTSGDELVYLSAPDADAEHAGIVRVSAYDLRAKTTRHVLEAPAPGICNMSSVAPVLLRNNRWLWYATEDDGCYRVNLETKTSTKLDLAWCLFGTGKRIFFIGDGSGGALTFGRIRTFPTLKEIPMFDVKPSSREGTSHFPVLATPANGTLFAYVEVGDEEKALNILDKEGRFAKKIVLLDGKPLEIDNAGPPQAEWSPDAKRLWMAWEVEDVPKIVEVNIDKGSAKVIELGGKSLTPVQFSLSPNGACLAVSAIRLDSVSKAQVAESGNHPGKHKRPIGTGDTGLCLVDLTGGERQVHLVFPSDAAAPSQTSARQ